MSNNFYRNELDKIEPLKTNGYYEPTIQIFANGNGEDTKEFSLNKESAKELIKWLADNFITN
jgi:hypothetical protein